MNMDPETSQPDEREQVAPEASGRDPLFADEAAFDGDSPADLAERHDEYLYDNRD